MNQGAAHFDRVFIAPEHRICQPVRARWFRAPEPLFTLIALNACLARQPRAVDIYDVADAADIAVKLWKELAGLIEERADIKAALFNYRASSARVVRDFQRRVLPRAPTALRVSWEADNRLLVMFGVAQASGELTGR